MSIVGRAAKAAFRTTWGPHDSHSAQAFRWSVVGEDYETKARAAIRAALDPDDKTLIERVGMELANAIDGGFSVEQAQRIITTLRDACSQGGSHD